MKMKKFCAKYKWQIGVFLVVFFSHLIFNPMVKSITSLPTELAAFSAAARIAGRDWSLLMSVTDYYGTGFYILFFPLFMIFKDPYALHQAILFVVVLVSTIPSILCYNLMTKYFKVSSEFYAALVAVSLSFVAVVRTNVAVNEHPLRVLLWCVVYLLVATLHTKERKRRIIYSIGMALLLAYSMTIHTRALTLIIAFVLTVLLVRLVLGLKCVEFWPFVITFSLSAVLSNLYVSGVTAWIWGSGELKNSTATVTNSVNLIELVFSRLGMKGYMNIVFGQLFSANVYTCGLFVIAIIIFLALTIGQLQRILEKRKSKKRKINFPEESLMDQTIYIIFFMMAACIVATILMHGLLSLRGAIGVVQTNTGAKSYFYLRYFFLYFQPIFMLLMVLLYHKSTWIEEHIRWVGYAWFVIVAYVLCMIAPTTIINPTLQLDRFHYLSPLVFREAGECLKISHFLVVSCLILGLSILLGYLMKKKKIYLINYILLVLFVYEYAYSVFGITMEDDKGYYSQINAFVEEVYRNEEVMETVDAVYYKGSTFPAYAAQFEMQDVAIGLGYPEQEWEGVVVLAAKNLMNEADFNYAYYVELDGNEFVYFKDESIYRAFQNEGFEVSIQYPIQIN